VSNRDFFLAAYERRHAESVERERRKLAAGWAPCIVIGYGDDGLDKLLNRARHEVIGRWQRVRP
jgi:hypothetical protein